MSGTTQRGTGDDALMGRDELVQTLRRAVDGGGFEDAAQTEACARAALHHLGGNGQHRRPVVPFVEGLEAAGLVWIAVDGQDVHAGFGGAEGFTLWPDEADMLADRLREAAASVRAASDVTGVLAC